MGLERFFSARRAELAARERPRPSAPGLLGGLGLLSPALPDIAPSESPEGRWEGVQPARRMVSLSALEGGDTTAHGTFAAGDPAGSQVSFSFETPPVPYASFRILGFEVVGWIDGDDGTDPYPASAWPEFGQLSVIVTNLTPRGYPNLVFGPQQLALGGQWGTRSADLFAGVRDNSPIRRLNRVRVAGYVTNPFAIPASPVGNKIVFALSIKVRLDVLSDDVFELRSPGPRP